MALPANIVRCAIVFCTLHLAYGASGREVHMTKVSGRIYISPFSTPVATCSGNPCGVLTCARACALADRCLVFSHNPTTGSCIISRKPDDDPLNYETTNADWDTFYTRCPTWKGYSVYSHQPLLCLRTVFTQNVIQEQASDVCQQDGANLVRFKSLDVYNILSGILVAATETRYVWAGADDRDTEQIFYWNDGTRLNQGTVLWQTSAEGFNSLEDCVCFSAASRLLDTLCDTLRPFICQYDVSFG